MPAPAPIAVHRPHLVTAATWILLPLLGGAAGLVLAHVPGWSLLLPRWVLALPMLPPADLLADLAAAIGTPAIIVLTVLGALAGGALALADGAEALTVRIDAQEVVVLRGEDEQARLPLAHLRCAGLDDGELILVDRDGAEPFRGPCDLAAGSLGAAFAAHGIHWSAADPHEADFTRWLDGAPDLTAQEHALLRERRRLLEKEDQDAEVRALREEAARHGIVVRDRSGIQQWRRAARATDAEGEPARADAA